ncbi:MAG: hypothetical protein GY801_47765 [bacterium]|nr:hypothetical protein [bacterium]
MRKNIEAIYPLSPTQQGMLVETLAAPDSGIHVEQMSWELQGQLDLSSFERVWQRIVARHSILRTGFLWKEQTEPLQFVLKEGKVPIAQQDWRDFSPEQQQERFQDELNADRRQGFHLTSVPVMRIAVIRLQTDLFRIIWTYHHILMDGWCIPLIMREFLTLYRGDGAGRNLPPVRPYREYILWLKEQKSADAENFWRESLKGLNHPTMPGKIENRTEALAPSRKEDSRYGEYQATLSETATRALHTLAQANQLSLNTLAQGAWAVLLSRYSGEENVVFGATISGRPPDLPGAENMIGLFITTIPVRVKMSLEASLMTWFQRIQTASIEQQSYSYCSTGQIHQWSEIPGILPLYETILVFENYPVDSGPSESSGQDLMFCRPVFAGAHTHYALTVLIAVDTDVSVKIVYDGSRFEKIDVEQIVTHLLTLLSKIAENPEQSLDTLLEVIPTEHIPVMRERRPTYGEKAVPARNTLEMQLIRIWEEILGVHPVGVRDNFFALGGYSMLALRLLAGIERTFGKNLPLSSLFQGATIENMAEILRQKTEELPWSPLVAIQAEGTRIPFFCVPGVGGNVIYFSGLARYLGTEQPFYGLQSVGLDGQAEPHTRIEDIAAHFIKAVQEVQPTGPYCLGGHSFGAKVAYEMTRQLQQQGELVALLVVLDTPLPLSDDGQGLADWDDARWLAEIASIIGQVFGTELIITFHGLQNLDFEEQVEYLTQQLKQANLLPQNSGSERVRTIVKVFQANMQAQYTPQPIAPTRIVLFRAEDVQIDESLRPELAEFLQKPAWGWEQFALDTVEMYDVPGDHISILAEPGVRVLAEGLQRCLTTIRTQ